MPVSTRQPSLVVNYTIMLNGNFPLRDGGGGEQGIGHIRLFGFDFLPSGTADTGGALLPISINTALFSLLSTNYGGNGSVTLGLPNLDGRSGISSGTGPGLTTVTEGVIRGSESTNFTQSLLPVARGGSGNALPTADPAQTINYAINPYGLFLGRSSGGTVLGFVGQITAFAGNFAPNGTIPCDGRLLAVADYDALFAVIGSTYGGDGVDTFAVPDLRGRVPIGAGNGIAVGQVLGAETVALTTNNLPIAMGGLATPISNYGPSLGIQFLVARAGIFPSRGGGTAPSGDVGDSPQLGEIIMFAGNYVPGGYALADGSTLSINQNQALFALLGTRYGGDGTTTFALPDLRGRAAIDEASGLLVGTVTGSATTTLTMADIPALTLNGTAGADTYYGSDLPDTINGNGGDDILNGNAGADIIDGGPGADHMHGGMGNDIFYVDDLNDVVSEFATHGTADEVRTTVSGYALPLNVEIITYIGAGTGTVLGNTQDNSITLGNAGGIVNFSQGGNDIGIGGAGQDGFYFGGAFDGNDRVDGGAGTLDQVALQGDYSAGVSLSATSAVGIEQFVLLPGSDTRFGVTGNPTESYNIITGNAAIATGQQLVFQANRLRAGENFTLDASGELDGSVFTYGGLGTENLRGSQNADAFFFGTGRFNPTDILDGQGGSDQLGLQGTYSGANAVTFGATQLTSIEMIVCLSNNDSRFGGAGSGTPYSYTLTMNNGNVAAGATLVVQANNLASDEVLTFDGSAELDGHFTIFSGNGADSITGGALADTISGRGGADNLTGGGGNDIFLYSNLSDSTAAARDHILDFTTGDVIDLSRIDANSLTAGNGSFSFIGAGAFTNSAGELRAVNTSGNDWLVEADANGDGVADLSILVTVADAHVLGAGDFVL